MNKIGFDNDKYLKIQSEYIKNRIDSFGNKLYLEFGGKLFDDYHASRVLPGFKPDSKIKMLSELKNETEILIVINADDIEHKKVRGDLGITYEADVLRLIDAFHSFGLYVSGVVISHYRSQSSAKAFKKHLEKLGITIYLHYPIDGYPTNINLIISENGYGKNEYIKTTKPLVVVTAPGPGSGKMAVCLSQLYHDHKHGVPAGYAKFETFPIWNLPLKHPINLAYEAATANLDDINMIDPFHLEAYGETTINYNRDIEIFPVLNTMFEKILGLNPYKSPTDMGVNMAGNCIIDDKICKEAGKQEIIRRYYHAQYENVIGRGNDENIYKINLLLEKAGITLKDRPVVDVALKRAKKEGLPAIALELPDGKIISGGTSTLLGAPAAVVLNSLKHLANINKEEFLISPKSIEPIQTLKLNGFGSSNPILHTDEILIALAISAADIKKAKQALEKIPMLKGCQVHSSVILSNVDMETFRKLGVNLTCEPVYQSNKFYHN